MNMGALSYTEVKDDIISLQGMIFIAASSTDSPTVLSPSATTTPADVVLVIIFIGEHALKNKYKDK